MEPVKSLAMAIEIRRATNADIEAVVGVIRPVYDEYHFEWDPGRYHADLYDLEAAYDQKGDEFYVAEVEGKVVGTVALERFPTVPGEPFAIVPHEGYLRVGGVDCSLERLYVHPSARRLGVGTACTEFIIALAKADGRTLMELWSDKKFGDAHRLYQRFGARVVGERICDDPDESPEWGLAIPLQESPTPVAE